MTTFDYNERKAMEYYVIAPDGQQYGPADLNTLKQWVAENRITQTTMLRHGPTGQTGMAGSVPGLFGGPTSAATAVMPPPQPQPMHDPLLAPGYQAPQPNPYVQTGDVGNPYQNPPQGQWAQSASMNRARTAGDYSTDRAQLIGVVVRVCIALVLVMIFRYAGLITSLYACFYAFTQANGNRYGLWMIVLAVACLAVVGLTWLLRFQGLITV